VPAWEKLPDVDVARVDAPQLSPRARLFKQRLKDEEVMARLAEFEPDNSAWFNVDKLLQRNPDFVAINSIFYHEFMLELNAELFPEVVDFFNALLEEKTPYRIVFDRDTEPPPWWSYPKRIDFLKNRITIFERNDRSDQESMRSPDQKYAAVERASK
jgi:hypothetical protein